MWVSRESPEQVAQLPALKSQHTLPVTHSPQSLPLNSISYQSTDAAVQALFVNCGAMVLTTGLGTKTHVSGKPEVDYLYFSWGRNGESADGQEGIEAGVYFLTANEILL